MIEDACGSQDTADRPGQNDRREGVPQGDAHEHEANGYRERRYHGFSLFSQRVWEHAQVLVVGALRAPGKRTVTAVLRVMGLSQVMDQPLVLS